jgi:hypothetical protein
MGCEPISNQAKYEFYRTVMEKFISDPSRQKKLSATDAGGQIQLLSAWLHRYKFRYLSIESNPTFPTQLADRPAASLLAARHGERDAQFPNLPSWPESTVFFFNTALLSSREAAQDWNGAPPLLQTSHAYGPSLREIWAKGTAAGAGDSAGWSEIRDWVLYRPPHWDVDDRRKTAKNPLYDRNLAPRLDTEVIWNSTNDSDFPWSAQSGSETWRVRLNDFPDEYMYSLMAGDHLIGDFHDWPDAWHRPEGPGWIDPNRPAKLTIFTAQKGVNPREWVPRYAQGEHTAVWNELVRVGPAVREDSHLEFAEQVCREMTRRSRQNLITIISRLHEVGFEFWSSMERKLIRLSEKETREPWSQPAVWEAPKKDVPAKFNSLEKKGIVIPLSLRIWAEEIGYVSLMGSHPVLCPFYEKPAEQSPLYADPFMVGLILPQLSPSLDDLEDGTEPLIISYDDVYKATISMDTGSDEEYSIEYPNATIDAHIGGLWYEANFLDYVRKSFEWGGFPGWERYDDRPQQELAYLKLGLLAI